MHMHFFILATELTKLNLKTNQRWDPYLNFDYLELVLPISFTELLSQAYRRTLIASHLAAHIYQILNISCECNCFCPEIQVKWKLFNFMTFCFISKYTETFCFFDFVYQVNLQNIITDNANNFISNFGYYLSSVFSNWWRKMILKIDIGLCKKFYHC